jgi:hypothetical protein
MMADFNKQRAEAARWMFEREKRHEFYWRWWVLTDEGNPDDQSNPHLPVSDADLVFASFIQEGLLLPTIVIEHGQPVGAHRINPSKEIQWQAIINPPTRLKTIWTEHKSNFIWTMIGTVLGFILGKIS